MHKEERDVLRFVIAGSVDDGKSTLIGRLLYETGGVYEDQLASIRQASDKRGKELDLSLITDGLRAEREQGITIDVAYRYFATPRRRFIIADSPGHEQYTRNMVTAASSAELAVIVIDARKGLLDQTSRHSYLVWLLGIRCVVIAVNKMDLVGFNQSVYVKICNEFLHATTGLNSLEKHFVPISALEGHNVVRGSRRMPWYEGPTLLDYLETIPVDRNQTFRGFRFPVQYVIRPNQDYRGYAGRVLGGTVEPGVEVVALPSQMRTRIEKIGLYKQELSAGTPARSVVLTTTDHVSLGRGDMLVTPDNIPIITKQITAALVWMSFAQLQLNHPYIVKHTTQTLCGTVTRLLHRIVIQTFSQVSADTLQMNEIGIVKLETHKPFFADYYRDNRDTGSFLMIDPITNDTTAAGLIIETIDDLAEDRPNKSSKRETNGLRRGLTVWLTGLSGAGKSTIARVVHTELLAYGLRVEVLDADELRKSLNSDLGFRKEDRDENVRRIGFIADLLTRHGVIVLVAAIAPYLSVRDEVRQAIGNFLEVHVDAPLNICEARDPKDLYRKARQGKIHGFTGIDDPYEPPLSPDIRCATKMETIKESASKVLAAILAFIDEGTKRDSKGYALGIDNMS